MAGFAAPQAACLWWLVKRRASPKRLALVGAAFAGRSCGEQPTPTIDLPYSATYMTLEWAEINGHAEVVAARVVEKSQNKE